MNLLDMISQICGEAGCDYYVELLISKSGQKVIKVRTAKRAKQPQVGGKYGIEQFVSDTANVTSKNISRELRNEPTSVFIYGGYVQTVYQQMNQAGIQQYWGKGCGGRPPKKLSDWVLCGAGGSFLYGQRKRRLGYRVGCEALKFKSINPSS